MREKLLGKTKTVKREPDKIWRSRDCEFKGLLAFITSLDRVTTRVLLIAQFMDTFHALEEQLTTQQLNYRTYPTIFEGRLLNTLSEYQSPEYVLLVYAPVLPDSSPIASVPAASWDFDVHVLIVEHHPLLSCDDHILGFVRQLPCRKYVVFHESLDGALLGHFGGMNISQLVTALQIPNNECISHRMIDRTIRQAQDKISRQVDNPIMADTAEQWFQYNLPRAS